MLSNIAPAPQLVLSSFGRLFSSTETKAEEKINNIVSAIEVFEKWLDQNGGGSSNKNEKPSQGDKVDTVPGLGFKDREAAEKTLK